MRSTPELDRRLMERLKEAVDQFDGGSADAFGRRIGYVNGGYIRECLRADPTRRKPVRESLIERVQQSPGLQDWFVPVFAASQSSLDFAQSSSIGGISAKDLAHRLSHTGVTIPQFDTGGAMGSGVVLRDQPGVIQGWRVDQDWLTKNVKGYSAANNLAIVTGFGDSMRPMFNPGDPLLVDTGVKRVDFDGVYFFRVDDEGYIKRLQRIPGAGLRVLSANRDNYEPWTITKDMSFEVFGRVLKVWRSEDF